MEKVVTACLEVGTFLIETAQSASPELKGSNDLITSADRSSEAMLKEALHKACPEASFLGEEAGHSAGCQGNNLIWVIDPLDGTVNYAFQIPLYSVSVALLKEGEPMLGVVYSPPLNELYRAEKGKGAFLNDQRLDVKNYSSRLLNLVATSAGMIESDFQTRSTSYHAKLLPHYNRLRLMGSQALHLCFVAAGRLEAALTNVAKLWDDAAGALILKESHGVYTNFRGIDIFPLPTDSNLFNGSPFESIGANSIQSLSKIVKLFGDEPSRGRPSHER